MPAGVSIFREPLSPVTYANGKQLLLLHGLCRQAER
jgi:hypothetical protein